MGDKAFNFFCAVLDWSRYPRPLRRAVIVLMPLYVAFAVAWMIFVLVVLVVVGLLMGIVFMLKEFYSEATKAVTGFAGFIKEEWKRP